MGDTSPLEGVKALYFDVFGTVVDWRSTVTKALEKQAEVALYLSDCAIPRNVRLKAQDMGTAEWGEFAAQWRQTYYDFTKTIAANPDLPYKTVDEHHLDSLKDLLEKWEITRLWRPAKVEEISLIWHRLDGWPDSSEGIRALNKKFQTCTLSNGNISLLTEMAEHAELEWSHIISAEMFKSFKPNPKVYLGAAEYLKLQPTECAMVAAHLNDLEAAHAQGFRTVYVERPQEERWDQEKIDQVKRDGWVDVWIKLDEDGFRAAAKQLGL